MQPEDPNSNVVPISRAVSPTYAVLEKFEDGSKERLGRKAGMLDRTIGRYLSSVRDVVESVIEKAEDLVEIPRPFESEAKHVEVLRTESDNVIGLRVFVQQEKPTLPERARNLAGVFSRHGNQILSMMWDDLAGGNSLVKKALIGTGVGLVGAWASGEAGATLAQYAFGGLAAASAVVAGYGIYAHRKVETMSVNGMGSNRVLILEHGYGGERPLDGLDWHFPNARFMSLAKDALRAHVLDEDVANACMRGMATEFAARVGQRDPSTILLHGVEMQTATGEYSISVPDVDAENGWRKVAVQRAGVLVEIDPSACAMLRDREAAPSPMPA